MRKKQENQSGFGVIGLLLVVVVVAVVGFSGWYVYHVKKTGNNSGSTASASKVPDQSQASSGQSDTVSSTVGDFTFAYPKSWTVASNTRPDEAVSLKSSGEQENSQGMPVSGALVDVYHKTINSSWFGSSLSDYMKNYGSATPTSVTIAGQSGLKVESQGVVAVAFTKDNVVYGIEEYYPSGSANPYPAVVGDIADSFKPTN